jgi:hypothetical protein
LIRVNILHLFDQEGAIGVLVDRVPGCPRVPNTVDEARIRNALVVSTSKITTPVPTSFAWVATADSIFAKLSR